MKLKLRKSQNESFRSVAPETGTAQCVRVCSGTHSGVKKVHYLRSMLSSVVEVKYKHTMLVLYDKESSPSSPAWPYGLPLQTITKAITS